jgi:asparagine synthase (glutamine-hydrolysing)
VPFLDHRIVEIALRMPQRFQHPGSALLLQACADLFPPGYMERPRQGISLPMAAWMRGPLRELCQIRLDALKASGWLDQAWIAGQWQAFEAGQIRWSRTWRLVVLGELASRELAR